MKKNNLLRICNFLVFLFLCVSFKSFSQEAKQKAIIDILSFDQLDSLFLNSKNEDFKTLELYADKMLSIARVHNDIKKKNIAFYNLVFAYKRQGKKEAALKTADSLTYYATKANDAYMLANSYNFKGTLAYNEGDLETAFKHYQKVIEADDPYMTLVGLNNVALIKKELQSPHEALKDVHLALKGYEKEKELYNEVGAIHLIGELHLDIYRLDLNSKHLDSTKYYIDLGLKKSKQYNDTLGHFLVLSTKGQWLQEIKQYDKALKSFQESLSYFEEEDDAKWSVFLYLYLGRLYDELQNHEATITVLEKANTILADKDFHFNDTPEIYLLLAKNYFNVQDHEKANANLEKYKTFSSKIHLDNRKLYANLHNAYDVSILEEKISQIETKASNKQQNILFITITIIIFIGLIALFYYKKNRNNRKKLVAILEKLEKPAPQEKSVPATINNTKIEDTNVQRILASLDQLEKTEYYLATSCTLSSVAKEIDTNTSYLSKIINEHKGKSFANYLNEYRINKVLVKLKSEKKYQLYTLKYIAEQFGFTRHETFSRVFKKQTEISPSYYLKKLKNDNL